MEPAVLPLVLAGAALKHVISWTLLPPPVPAEKPNRKLDGRYPLFAVMMLKLGIVVLGITEMAEPPLIAYENVSTPAWVMVSE